MSSKYQASPTQVEQGLYIAYASLATLAFVPIYFGAFSSLNKWKDPKEKSRKIKRQINDEDDEDQDAPSESLSADDTFKFPILGSLVLFGLHYALREFDTAYVNCALTTYFSIMGFFSTTQVGVNTLTSILGLLGIKVDSWHINLARPSKEFYTAKFTLVHLVMLAASVMLAGYYAATKNWIASNILAFSLALSAIQVFSLESFKAGIVLLGGLCISDAYWTYGSSEILHAVVKQVDIPIKVAFPRLLLGLPLGKAYKFASLGLGEIIAPGLFVALCLRFDQHRAGQRNVTLGHSTGFRKPYFIASLLAYVLGLGVHFYVNHTLKTTQPLIAYLSFACILSVFLTATVRRESKQVFGYTSEAGLAIAKAKKAALDKKKRLQAQKKQAAARRTAPPRAIHRVSKEELYAAKPSPTVSVSGDSAPGSPAI
ncbi:hypothetical protein BG015_007605 [Linnemannia schmuckeri]|uniref:Uncharacterized protein n=1 Tax=Linnemannia schmuckeri TaxID=64567 RepID=A0A9P5S0U3_9FUNG|nr:hypothetical protein BG015_007605 [Linnemannia schmuckeri]